MENDPYALAAMLTAQRMILAEIIKRLTSQPTRAVWHAALTESVGTALDAEDLPLAASIQAELDAVFAWASRDSA